MEDVASQNQPKSSFLDLIKQNKHLVLLFFLGLVLLGVIVLIVFFSVQPRTSDVNNTPEPSLTRTPFPSESATPSIVDETENKVILIQTKPQLDTLVTVPFEATVVKIYDNSWANVKIANTEVGDASVVVKKEAGIWKIVLGPGTYFDEGELINVGAPQALINDFLGIN